MKNEEHEINGQIVKIPIPESYRDCIKIIKSDCHRLYGKTESFLIIIIKTLLKPFRSSVRFWASAMPISKHSFPFFI